MTWQPIETAPQDGTRILACRIGGSIDDYDMVQWWDGAVNGGEPNHYRACWWIDNDKGSWSPTHWMPLPEPPNAE